MRAVAVAVDQRAGFARRTSGGLGEVGVEGEAGSMLLCIAKCGWRMSSPESITAQAMSVPTAAKELCAASALTVASDFVIHAEIGKSGQMR